MMINRCKGGVYFLNTQVFIEIFSENEFIRFLTEIGHYFVGAEKLFFVILMSLKR